MTAAPFLVGRKLRSGDRIVEIGIDRIDMVRGRTAVLLDDVVSTGSTVRQAARLLLEGGAARADLYVTHMLCSEQDTAALRAADCPDRFDRQRKPSDQRGAACSIAGKCTLWRTRMLNCD